MRASLCLQMFKIQERNLEVSLAGIGSLGEWGPRSPGNCHNQMPWSQTVIVLGYSEVHLQPPQLRTSSAQQSDCLRCRGIHRTLREATGPLTGCDRRSEPTSLGLWQTSAAPHITYTGEHILSCTVALTATSLRSGDGDRDKNHTQTAEFQLLSTKGH